MKIALNRISSRGRVIAATGASHSFALELLRLYVPGL